MILWRHHHTCRDPLELLQHWWRNTSSDTHLTEGQQLQQPGAQPWHRLVVLKGPHCQGSLPRFHCWGWPWSCPNKGLMWSCCWRCSGKLWSGQRSDCHTTMCSLHSSAPTALNGQCKEPFKCHSSRAARTKCFLFVSLRSLTNPNEMKCAGGAASPPSRIQIPGLPVLGSNSHPAHPATLCPPRESCGGNHTFGLGGKLRGITLLTAKIKCDSEIRAASADSIGKEESVPEHSNHWRIYYLQQRFWNRYICVLYHFHLTLLISSALFFAAQGQTALLSNSPGGSFSAQFSLLN